MAVFTPTLAPVFHSRVGAELCFAAHLAALLAVLEISSRGWNIQLLAVVTSFES